MEKQFVWNWNLMCECCAFVSVSPALSGCVSVVDRHRLSECCGAFRTPVSSRWRCCCFSVTVAAPPPGHLWLLHWVHPAWTGSDGGKLWLVVVILSISISISMSLLEQLPQWCFSLWLLLEKPSEQRLPNFNLMLFQFFWRFFLFLSFLNL